MLRLIHSAEYQAVSWGEHADLQVGDQAFAGLDELVGFDAEHVVLRTRHPHLVALQQVGLHARAVVRTYTKSATS
jgi:hypothetical protein